MPTARVASIPHGSRLGCVLCSRKQCAGGLLKLLQSVALQVTSGESAGSHFIGAELSRPIASNHGSLNCSGKAFELIVTDIANLPPHATVMHRFPGGGFSSGPRFPGVRRARDLRTHRPVFGQRMSSRDESRADGVDKAWHAGRIPIFDCVIGPLSVIIERSCPEECFGRRGGLCAAGGTQVLFPSPVCCAVGMSLPVV